MKYKVGDKVIVRSDLEVNMDYGSQTFVREMSQYIGKVVTISETYSNRYNIKEDEGEWSWTDEMFDELVDDELTAEEATRILGGICCENQCSYECPIYRAKGKMSCWNFRRDKPEEVLEIIKQWKKDHEKKPIETEFVNIVRVIEDTDDVKRCVYEESIPYGEDWEDAQVRVLKKYCKKHGDNFFAVMECRCVVKE